MKGETVYSMADRIKGIKINQCSDGPSSEAHLLWLPYSPKDSNSCRTSKGHVLKGGNPIRTIWKGQGVGMGLGSSILEESEMPPLSPFSFYVYICAYTHVHVYAQGGYPCMCTEARGGYWLFLYTFLCYPLEAESLTEPRAFLASMVAGQPW